MPSAPRDEKAFSFPSPHAAERGPGASKPEAVWDIEVLCAP